MFNFLNYIQFLKMKQEVNCFSLELSNVTEIKWNFILFCKKLIWLLPETKQNCKMRFILPHEDKNETKHKFGDGPCNYSILNAFSFQIHLKLFNFEHFKLKITHKCIAYLLLILKYIRKHFWKKMENYTKFIFGLLT